MTELKKTDIIKILTLIRANYDNAYANTSEAEAEMLINFWYDCLNKYSYELVYEATKNAISTSEFIPRLANIVAEAEKLANPNKKSTEQLWAELTSVLGKIYDLSRYLIYPQHHDGAMQKIAEIYNSLDGDLKLYVVNPSTLIELSELTTDDLKFEKTRFFKQMPQLTKHAEDKMKAQTFLKVVSIPPTLPDGRKNKK